MSQTASTDTSRNDRVGQLRTHAAIALLALAGLFNLAWVVLLGALFYDLLIWLVT